MFGSSLEHCVKHAWYGKHVNDVCPYCLDDASSVRRMDKLARQALEIMENEMKNPSYELRFKLGSPQEGVNNIQHGGTHYKDKSVQPWDYIAANGLGYFEGNVVKYVSRWREKGGVEDLLKARHYLDKLIELETRDAGKTN